MKRSFQKSKSTIFSRIVVSALTFLTILALVIGGLFFIPIRMPERITIVVASSPFQLLSLNTRDRTASIVKIPEDLTIKGAYSMGTYPIASYWKMGSLDVRDHDLLARSIQVALGIPVDGYIGHSYESLFEQSEKSELIRENFSLSGIIRFLTHQRVTNISPINLIRIYKIVKSVRESDIKILDLAKSMSTIDEVLPDDSIQQRIDPERTDVILKNMFVYPEIRKEALTIGVNNAANIPELASNISRQLTHTGMFVVSVTSDENVKTECELSGNESVLTSKTARFITDRYQCKPKLALQSQREDLVMHIGTDIGSLYIPRGK